MTLERPKNEYNYWRRYYRRERLAQLLGRWTHKFLLTKEEILTHNQKLYDYHDSQCGH